MDSPDVWEVTGDYAFQPFICTVILPSDDEKNPFPRSGHRIVCDDGNFYSYGGYNPDHNVPFDRASDEEEEGEENRYSLFPEVWKYNFAHMKWKKLPIKDIPRALASNAVLLSGKLIIVYGGTGLPFHLTRSNSLYVCNMEDPNPKFQLIQATGQEPPPLYGQAIFMKDDYIYVIGGTTGFDYYIDIHRLNLHTNVWEEVYIYKGHRNDPPGRYRHELAIVGDKIYVIGGGIGREAYNFEQIPVFDLKTRTWDNLITVRDAVHGYPIARQYHSVVRIPESNSFVMMGGMISTHVFDDAWRLDIPTMQWTTICSLRLGTPVYFHASCVTPSGKMYTFGGVSKTEVEQERVSHIQTAWLIIPKLKDICWDAIVEYGLFYTMENEDVKVLPTEYTKRLVL